MDKKNMEYIMSKTAQKARQINYEGCVLLKNEQNVLPLRSGERISVFGRMQKHYYKSGTGSGGLVHAPYETNILDSLRERPDIIVNERLAAVYDKWTAENPFDAGHGWTEPWSQNEMPLDDMTVRSAAGESDKALIIIGRTAGEDKDNSISPGSLMLTDKEEAMLASVSRYFVKFCVLLNTGNIIDMSWVEKYKVPSVMYIWQGGQEGGRAAADVICGSAYPSGKLTDTIARSVLSYPSSQNFGNECENIYSEDIYVGYRYFETFAKDEVMYPFGFGLSYTSFDVSCKYAYCSGGKIIICVSVANTGTFAGRETVQTYFEAPQGLLGKPACQLAAFCKTDELKPGQIQDILLSFNVSDMAAYDDSGITGYPFCYLLEPGKYKISVGTDAEHTECVYTYTVNENIVTHRSEQMLAPVRSFKRIKPVYKGSSYVIEHEPVPQRQYDLNSRIKQRSPSEFPKPLKTGLTLFDVKTGKASMDEFIGSLSVEALMHIAKGEGLSSPKVTPGAAGCFGGITSELAAAGIPIACAADGPSGIRLDSGLEATSIPNGTLLACTWNTSAVEELFSCIGAEMAEYDIDCLLGPGVNIHRDPRNGRNFEYFSEDPLLSGKMAAAVAKGLSKAGKDCTLKHFMANNQELSRTNVESVISERAIREIYAKPFEIAVKAGNVRAVMTAYNLINGFHAASCYDLTTTLLRKEWGFTGIVMTDWGAKMNDEGALGNEKNLSAMAAAQNDVYMVVPESPRYDDDLLDALQKGKLTKSVLQRNAANLCRFLMDTAAFERFLKNGAAYIHSAEKKKKLAEFDMPSNMTEYDVTVSGMKVYTIEITAASYAPGTAQLPIWVYANGYKVNGVSLAGSGGEYSVYTTTAALRSGKNPIMLEFPKDIEVRSMTVFE